jgi:magnesium transporter
VIYAYQYQDSVMRVIDDPSDFPDAAWIDVSEPTEEEFALIASLVPHHLSDEEDADEIEASTRSYIDDQGIHISTLFMHWVENKPENTSVTLVFASNRLITLHDRDIPAIRLMRMRARRQPHLLKDPLELFAELFETAVLDLGDTLQELYRDLEKTSHLVLEDPGADLEGALARLAGHENVNGKVRLCLMDTRRDLTFFLRSSQPTRECVDRLRHLVSEIDALLPHNDYIFEKVNFLLQASQGFINIEQNKIIKIFSVAATAFLPPTLIASIYGMNFTHLPELSWTFGYPLSILAMLVSALLPLLYFKRKGWL